MPHRNHTGPEGEGSRTGRGMGMCGGKATTAAAYGEGNATGDSPAQAPGMGRCCRHGQGRNTRGHNGAMNGQGMDRDMGQGMDRGRGRGRGRGQCMGPNMGPNMGQNMRQATGPCSRADRSGAAPAPSSDGTDNNS